MKINYHTHTARCMHAVGTDEEYVQAAIQAGFSVLGMSDHAPFPFASGYVSGIRMTCEEYPEYIASFRSLRDKYAGIIRLHIGLECEYFPRYLDHIRRLKDDGASYLILGQHFPDSEECTPAATVGGREDEGVLRYAESVVSAIHTGEYAYLAHPDLFMKYRTDDQFNAACERAADMICQAALEADLPIEYNLLGQLVGNGYPSLAFWRYAARWHNRVILGVDAHDPKQFLRADNIALGEKRMADLGFQVIERLPMDE